ncbi:hypothetical protein E4U52_000995, partial [Claviceps spartinae]
MWANIGEELKVPWELAEIIHWRLGAKGMAERAGVPLSSQAAVEFAPPPGRNSEVNQHTDQEHDLAQQSSRTPHSSLSQSELAPMTHDSLQVEPGSFWTAEYRSEADEAAEVDIVTVYNRYKANMWAQIAAKMAISWDEAETMHWYLGKAQMRKRGSDDSFSTTCINLTPSQVEDAEVQARRQQKQEQETKNPRSEWSGKEEAMLFAYRRAKMSWKSISALLPGRSNQSCQAYYRDQCKLGPAWPQERRNELCKLYESLKSSMWAEIGQELKVPWEVAEGLHWRLGAQGMADGAGDPLRSPATVGFAPPRDRDAEAHQHTDQEHDVVQQSSRHTYPHPHPHPPLSQYELSPMMHEGQPGTSETLP